MDVPGSRGGQFGRVFIEMKTLTLVGRKKPGKTYWEYAMTYEEACRKYKRELEDLGFLKMRLETATILEYERVQGNIESKRTAIDMLKRWFKFTGNKIPETA